MSESKALAPARDRCLSNAHTRTLLRRTATFPDPLVNIVLEYTQLEWDTLCDVLSVRRWPLGNDAADDEVVKIVGNLIGTDVVHSFGSYDYQHGITEIPYSVADHDMIEGDPAKYAALIKPDPRILFVALADVYIGVEWTSLAMFLAKRYPRLQGLYVSQKYSTNTFDQFRTALASLQLRFFMLREWGGSSAFGWIHPKSTIVCDVMNACMRPESLFVYELNTDCVCPAVVGSDDRRGFVRGCQCECVGEDEDEDDADN